MPGKPDKPHRIRVRTLDGKPRDQGAINKLKSNQLGMPHLDIVSSNVANELIVCASKEAHIEQVRAKLAGAGLEEVPGGEHDHRRERGAETEHAAASAGRLPAARRLASAWWLPSRPPCTCGGGECPAAPR
jgi:hypothetical protein